MATREGDQRARKGPRTWINRSILEMRRISELKSFCAVRSGKERKAISLGDRTPRKCRSFEVHASFGGVEALPVASRKDGFCN